MDTANLVLPPVSRVHWCGAKRWDWPKIRIDPTVKNHFKAGSNPTAVSTFVRQLQRSKYGDFEIRYSDGSSARGKVGIGVTGSTFKECHRLPDQCSIFSAEAAAAFIAATTPSDRNIAVFTDSASVVSALGSDAPRHPWIQAIQKYSAHTTVFIWIPGHCGVKGNEEADHLAASGRQMAIYNRAVPAEDLKRWITNTIWDAWGTEWLGSRDLAIRKVKGDTGRWEDPPLHRDQVILSRLRTGHSKVSHDFSGTGPFKRICDLCSVQQTVEHLLCYCPRYNGPREEMDIDPNIGDILGKDPVRTAILFNFLKQSGLYSKI